MTRNGLHRVLGVDPAFRKTGWAVLEGRNEAFDLVGCGVIAAAEGPSRSENLHWIQRQLCRVLTEWTPELAVFELPGRWMHRVGSSRFSIEVMAMARGAMLSACFEVGVPALEIEFQQVRRALVGRANATSKDVLDFVRSLGLALPTRRRGGIDADIANAVLMGVYGIETLEGREQNAEKPEGKRDTAFARGQVISDLDG